VLSRFLQTEEISFLKLNKKIKGLHMQSLFSFQQPQPQLLFPQSQPLLPQPEKRMMTRSTKRMMHQQLFPPKHELHIIEQLLELMYLNRVFCAS
jgi:hypothetical protein